ncbi:hypothetical protein HOF40_00105 [Candidatus Parcubacteria bacterium]|jgi:chromosome segregation ATPase|nr:hypothetical protein [Candidatus Parcubacteria bacterium]MBT3948473.1 hypothetical protein [Candidatus Parcubacteria bacterium]
MDTTVVAIKHLQTDVGTLKQGFKELRQDIHDLVDFLKENMVTKEELNNLRLELKADIVELQTNVQNIEQDMNYVKQELKNIKIQLGRLEQKTQEDDGVVATELYALKARVKELETFVKKYRKKQHNS